MDRVLLNTSGTSVQLASRASEPETLRFWWFPGLKPPNGLIFCVAKRLNLQNYIRLLFLLAWLKKRQSGYSPVFCHVWFINQPSKITHAFPRSYPWLIGHGLYQFFHRKLETKSPCAQFCRLNQGEISHVCCWCKSHHRFTTEPAGISDFLGQSY